MARTSSRRHKGCRLCKPWKHAGNGDAWRMPASALRQYGQCRRVTRKSLGRDYDDWAGRARGAL